MTILRKNTNYGVTDISPRLQDTLNANGMQAHITMTQTGDYELVTLSHNSSEPRRYPLDQQQVESLMNGGTSAWDKKAYNTFVGIVKEDYYIPGSFVAARNANSPVNMGLDGHRLAPGEYGYREPRFFYPFEGPRYGRFDSIIDGLMGLAHGGRIRRIDGRPFYANSAPVVIDRPDGRLRPGEMKTGAYGFYDKGMKQKQDVLQSMSISEQQLPKVERPKGQSVPLNSISSPVYMSAEKFQQVLSSHGVVVDEKNNLLTIKSASVPTNLEYKLNPDETKKLMNEKFKYSDKKGVHNKDGVSVNERLAILNAVIGKDFTDKITVEMLNSKDYVDIKLKPEVEKELGLHQEAANQYMASKLDIIDMKDMREDYRSGFLDRWNSIGVVDGRGLNPNEGFYLPVKDGRAVSVGEIQVSPVNDGKSATTFRMTAVINNQVMSHDISKEDYIKFINYNDEYRLKLFDKVFDEVKIKDASNGVLEDPVRSGRIEDADGVAVLNGHYNLVNDNVSAAITGAMAYKDQISGNYMLNMRESKDIGMWSYKITEEQYLAFKNADDDGKARLLSTIIPITDENKQPLSVVKEIRLPLSTAEKRVSSYSENIDMKDALQSGAGRPYNERMADALNKTIFKDAEHIKATALAGTDVKAVAQGEAKLVAEGKAQPTLTELRENVKIALKGEAGVNGQSLENSKPSKEWVRSGGHGRATEVGDIAVERLRDAEGKVIEGKYKMTAVIDGNVFSHEITQKDFDKFRAINDTQRMKLFDKIFPEVEMKTKAGHGFNLGAAILAAVSVGMDVVGSVMAEPRPRPEFYASRNVFSKPGVASPEAVSAALYESESEHLRREPSEGRGMGI
ncbi:hypothetical protein SAMN02745202_01244 [Segatella oulorum]|jgi:hypothetical protein|uniref:DUF3945 domain-containing protein n=1 Tax=Segatella oulorum TaxID=28136 RepID=A0A1T4P028_9BACT|nr:hypothetical protein [Segatella oulorum]SJZ84677.1 hypothetical protein SAMN02745202_01244 [Segatella oulorum]